MRTRVSDPDLLADLAAHLRRMGCVTEAVSADTLQVSIPGLQQPDAATLELDLYLRLWEVTSAGEAELID